MGRGSEATHKRYKRLNPFHLIEYPEELQRFIETELPHEKCVPPVFNKPGYYYDRKLQIAWFEIEGHAWLSRREDFLYRLLIHNQKRLSQSEITAIETLRLYNNCPKDLIRQLQINRGQDALIRIRRNGLRARLKYKNVEQ